MKKRLIVTAVFLAAAAVLAAAAYILYIFLFIPHRYYTNADFNINTYISPVDMDNDGIDDQTDILQNVRRYILTKPRYKSRYYAAGYPDDGYGVCTDVVGFGLRGAGYDLMELVNADILENPGLYNVEKHDKKIDFRRVVNLKVYFENNAAALTTDIYETDQWQGGDIVIFEKHIGVVSDRRNKKGIALVIHHANPVQRNYEEDILEKRDDIIGHYRIS